MYHLNGEVPDPRDIEAPRETQGERLARKERERIEAKRARELEEQFRRGLI